LSLKAEGHNRADRQKQKNKQPRHLPELFCCVCDTQWTFDHGDSRWYDCGHIYSATVIPSTQKMLRKTTTTTTNKERKKQTQPNQKRIFMYKKEHFHKSQGKLVG